MVDLGDEHQKRLWKYHPVVEPTMDPMLESKEYPMLEGNQHRRAADGHRQIIVEIQCLDLKQEILESRVEEL